MSDDSEEKWQTRTMERDLWWDSVLPILFTLYWQFSYGRRVGGERPDISCSEPNCSLDKLWIQTSQCFFLLFFLKCSSFGRSLTLKRTHVSWKLRLQWHVSTDAEPGDLLPTAYHHKNHMPKTQLQVMLPRAAMKLEVTCFTFMSWSNIHAQPPPSTTITTTINNNNHNHQKQ